MQPRKMTNPEEKNILKRETVLFGTTRSLDSEDCFSRPEAKAEGHYSSVKKYFSPPAN